MARLRHNNGASGIRKAPESMWERAGARAGDGAGALFASLDAQDAQDTQNPIAATTAHMRAAAAVNQAHERGAQALEWVAAQIRAGAWNSAIAALVAEASNLLDEQG
jgi:hypothetical protein